MQVAVFGSVNMDLVVQVPRLPRPGETLLGNDFASVPGGKGANQAVAAARLGQPTLFVGRCGRDDLGGRLRQALATAGVDTAGLVGHPGASGVALIYVDEAGENQIVVAPGANARVGAADVERLPMAPDTMLLMQLEIPLAAVTQAAVRASRLGQRVMLDPAPAPETLPSELYKHIDILTPNQGEATRLSGIAVQDLETATAAARALQRQGPQTVVVKLGAQGCVAVSGAERFVVPAFKVKAVDTVGAGDAFNGGLAVALAEGQPLEQALGWASAVAALAVTQPGAQAAMPHRQAVEEFMQDPQGSA